MDFEKILFENKIFQQEKNLNELISNTEEMRNRIIKKFDLYGIKYVEKDIEDIKNIIINNKLICSMFSKCYTKQTFHEKIQKQFIETKYKMSLEKITNLVLCSSAGIHIKTIKCNSNHSKY